jgi:peptidoglycan/LPS O-acetylase OafA/YrhL
VKATNSLKAMLSYAALLALEVVYVLFWWDPLTTRTQSGLMPIFACEVAFGLRLSKVQLQLKRDGAADILRRSRIFAAVWGLGLLSIMAGLASLNFPGERVVIAALFLVIACSKILWERQFGRYTDAAAKTEPEGGGALSP